MSTLGLVAGEEIRRLTARAAAERFKDGAPAQIGLSAAAGTGGLPRRGPGGPLIRVSQRLHGAVTEVLGRSWLSTVIVPKRR